MVSNVPLNGRRGLPCILSRGTQCKSAGMLTGADYRAITGPEYRAIGSRTRRTRSVAADSNFQIP